MILRTIASELFSCLLQSQGSRNIGTFAASPHPFLGENVWSLDWRYFLWAMPGSSLLGKVFVCLVGNKVEGKVGPDSAREF